MNTFSVENEITSQFFADNFKRLIKNKILYYSLKYSKNFLEQHFYFTKFHQRYGNNPILYVQ